MDERRRLIAAAVIVAGYLLLLGLAPLLFPPDATLPNAAARLGYNLDVAWLAAVVWTIVAIVGVGLVGRAGSAAPLATATEDARPAIRGRRLELAAVFAFFFLLYCPLFLARQGDFVEDKYFLSALWRMQCGAAPYRDFEFLYGPLMIYPAHWWTALFGFSLKSHYFLAALLEGAFFATLMAVLQRCLPDRRARWIAFVLLLPALIDVLMGLNYIGWRRMLPVFSLLIVAARPLDRRAVAAAAGILGFEFAFSFEFAAAGLAACGAVYALLLAQGDRWRVAAYGAALAAASVAIGIALILMSTGAVFGDYLSSTREILAEAGRLGLGAFKFGWTLHTLALFALLSIAAVVIGASWRHLHKTKAREGDLLLVGAVVYALVGLKIALQRADIWHMSAPFLALIVAVLVARPVALFTISSGLRRMSVGLIAVAAIANVVGYAPMGKWLFGATLHGALDVARGAPVGAEFPSRGNSIEPELTYPNKSIVALAAWLADDSRASRPVLFYNDRWWMGHHLGVCPIGYSFYDLQYSDDRAPLRADLDAHPDAYVIMALNAYERLFEGKTASKPPRLLTLIEKAASVLASPHYGQAAIEDRIEEERWDGALGSALALRYEKAARFGTTVVLKRKETE